MRLQGDGVSGCPRASQAGIKKFRGVLWGFRGFQASLSGSHGRLTGFEEVFEGGVSGNFRNAPGAPRIPLKGLSNVVIRFYDSNSSKTNYKLP